VPPTQRLKKLFAFCSNCKGSKKDYTRVSDEYKSKSDFLKKISLNTLNEIGF